MEPATSIGSRRPSKVSASSLHALGQWGMTYTRDLIKRSDLDPGLLMWGLRRRADLAALPDHRVVVRFEFSGVPASRTKFRIMWLVLERSGVKRHRFVTPPECCRLR